MMLSSHLIGHFVVDRADFSQAQDAKVDWNNLQVTA